jgi:cation diffusion facilitator family transporter
MIKTQTENIKGGNLPSFECPHDHFFLSEHRHINERRTRQVILLTVVTMVLEIISGMLFGSMALLADGWHMASHASAMSITALAYYLTRKHQENPRFTFGTGKIGDLAGYTSALLLLVIALVMAYESVIRFLNPVSIRYHEAMLVAVIGLGVNLFSAYLLKEQEHPGGENHHHHDHNLRAAYLHVIADALTSILALVALGLGMIMGWAFLDPIMGIVGAVLISKWSYGLMRLSAGVLLDHSTDEELTRGIREAISPLPGVEIVDLHAWRLGPGHFSAILSLRTSGNEAPGFFKTRLCHLKELSHVTIEINPSDCIAEIRR